MNAKKLREAFASAKARHAIVEIDGIGEVMIRELTLGDFDEVDQDATADARARNVALTLFSADGSERIFDPDNQNDLEIIKGLGGTLINKLTTALTEKN